MSRARETANRTVCASNLRQIGQAFLNYADSDESGWFPAKPKFRNPDASVKTLAGVQHQAAPEWGPNFSGIIRDIVERKHTHEGASLPQFLPAPKVLLCPSDKINNRPQTSEGILWPTASINRFTELPRTRPEEGRLGKSFISYFYVALWRNDDRGDYLMMSDQSNKDDTTTQSFTGLTPEDNHGTRGVNVLLLDSHVEWSPAGSGSFEDLQQLSNRYWGHIISAKSRYPGTNGNRSSEVQTIE